MTAATRGFLTLSGWLSGTLLAIVPGGVLVAQNSRPALAASTTAMGSGAPSITDTQHLFYNGNYEAAAAEALTLRTDDPGNLSAYEVRTSALHFQIKRLLGEPRDKDRALKECLPCADLLSAFTTDVALGQKAARDRVAQNAHDNAALFFLGKIDLNYVWLQLDTLGRRTGWSEFREARRSLDAALRLNPADIRTQVARGWIDYIVDTRVPLGFRWILGGGDKKHGLLVVRQAAESATDLYPRTEAIFGLWNMQIREHDDAGALATARLIARDFPENKEVARFIADHDPTAARLQSPPQSRP